MTTSCYDKEYSFPEWFSCYDFPGVLNEVPVWFPPSGIDEPIFLQLLYVCPAGVVFPGLFEEKLVKAATDLGVPKLANWFKFITIKDGVYCLEPPAQCHKTMFNPKRCHRSFDGSGGSEDRLKAAIKLGFNMHWLMRTNNNEGVETKDQTEIWEKERIRCRHNAWFSVLPEIGVDCDTTDLHSVLKQAEENGRLGKENKLWRRKLLSMISSCYKLYHEENVDRAFIKRSLSTLETGELSDILNDDYNGFEKEAFRACYELENIIDAGDRQYFDIGSIETQDRITKYALFSDIARLLIKSVYILLATV